MREDQENKEKVVKKEDETGGRGTRNTEDKK